MPQAKLTSSLLLTTHSMEEAEHLCDRLSIFNHGALECVGTAAELKKRYVTGFKLTVTIDDMHAEPQLVAFISANWPDAKMLSR